MWQCPVCQTENDNFICKACGFDERHNYVRYASLFELTPAMLAKAQCQWTVRDPGLDDLFVPPVDIPFGANWKDALKHGGNGDFSGEDAFKYGDNGDFSGEDPVSDSGIKKTDPVNDSGIKKTDSVSDSGIKKTDSGSDSGIKKTDPGSDSGIKKTDPGSDSGIKKTDSGSDSGIKKADHGSDSGKAKFMKFKVDKAADAKKPDASGSDVKIKSGKVLYCTECGKPLRYICSDGLVCKRCGRFFAIDIDQNIQEVTSDTKHSYFMLLFESERYRNVGLYTKELAVLKKMLKKYGMTTFILTKMGRAYRALKNYTKSMECYRRALAIDPDDGLIYSNMGVLCYVQDSYDTAIYYYRQAMSHMDESDTEFPTFLANYAMALGTVGERAHAEFMLNRAQRLGYQKADVIRRKLGY